MTERLALGFAALLVVSVVALPLAAADADQ